MPNTGFKWRYKNQSGYCCANFIFHISLGDSTSQMQFCTYKYVTEIGKINAHYSFWSDTRKHARKRKLLSLKMSSEEKYKTTIEVI